jgi:hypothetical protein
VIGAENAHRGWTLSTLGHTRAWTRLGSGCGARPGYCPGPAALLAAPFAGDPGYPAQGPALRRGEADAAAAVAGARGDEGQQQEPSARTRKRGIGCVGHGGAHLDVPGIAPAIILKSQHSARVPKNRNPVCHRLPTHTVAATLPKDRARAMVRH